MRFLFILFFLLIISTQVYSIETKPLGRLIVFIENFESDEGNVRVHLYDYDTRQYFPAISDKAYRLVISPIKDNKAIVVFEGLPYGSYALTVHHDKNSNVKMDKNFLGMPAEGWGLSRNIIPILSLPTFEDCQFELKKEITNIRIIVRN